MKNVYTIKFCNRKVYFFKIFKTSNIHMLKIERFWILKNLYFKQILKFWEGSKVEFQVLEILSKRNPKTQQNLENVISKIYRFQKSIF